MKKLTILFVMTMLVTQVACAAQKKASDPVSTFMEGCEKELKQYCNQVTPGEGRLVACLYAHQDKISGQCEYAVYDAAMQLERAIAALSYVANECRDDLLEYCGDVEIGDGRVMDCMEKNKSKLSDRCTQAIKDVSE